VAAIRRRTGWGVAGHKEHQPGGYGHSSVKTDPSFDMNRFRQDVEALIREGLDDVSARDVWSYDPDDPADRGAIANAPHRHDAKTNPTVRPAFALSDMWKLVGEVRAEQTAARARDEAILKAVTGSSGEAILAEIRRQGEQTRAAIARVVPDVLAALPTGDGPVSREDLVAALTAVLGSLDGATPDTGRG